MTNGPQTPGFAYRLRLLHNVVASRGVTVLEVLISIGVAAVGLLGVILLIPLADHQMNRGFVLERANQVGANAFREFEVRGMHNPHNWKLYFPATGNYTSLPQPTYTNVQQPPDGPVSFTRIEMVGSPAAPVAYRRAFAIDPRMVANYFGLTAAEQTAVRRFPYNNSNTIRWMPRLTLNSPATLALNPPGNGSMTLTHADAVFIADDDLVFQRSNDDRTLPPLQLDNEGASWQFSAAAAGGPAPTQLTRQAQERMSWMATLVPQEPSGVVSRLSDLYVLSIVVYHQRDGALLIDEENERTLRIPLTGSYNGFKAGGVGGGEVALFVDDTTYPGLSREEALSVRAGDWVLLTPSLPFTVAPLVGDQWRWYRVLAADSEVIDSDSGMDPNAPPDHWIRYVTLDGLDWTPRETQVIAVKNVVAVFEKTIRLETSSLWIH
jgi:hypothetical protein